MNLRKNLIILLSMATALSVARPTQAYEHDAGNAPVEVIIPLLVPRILQAVSPGDAPLILRITTSLTTSWFDASAPYHPTAVGVHSDLGRRPAGEQIDRNRNIAILYASHEILVSLLPQFQADWNLMLSDAGLDPNDDQVTIDNAIGIGNAAGKAVVSFRETDGMNQLGDADGTRYNRQPYSDYTGFKPKNNAYHLENPKRWQPDILSSGNGIFSVQQFVTPQLEMTQPISYRRPTLRAAVPKKSFAIGKGGVPRAAYIAQADQVLQASANLSDYQKLVSEFFDDKLASLGFSILFIYQTRGLSLQQFVELDFLTNLASFDAAVTIWREKRRYNSVRPFSAIGYIYGDENVTAWGGPGKGTVNDISGSEWKSYLQSANHPEYPSASASFCRAHATAASLYLDDNSFGWAIAKDVGSSVVEPGLTPTVNTTLGPWNTWDDFSDECGISRLWAGVHFFDSIPAGQGIGDKIGRKAFKFVRKRIRGVGRPIL